MDNEFDTSGQYRTSDLYYAAYLKVAQVPLKDTVREGGKVVFLFEAPDREMMRALKREYFNGRAKGSFLEYKQAIQTMKQLTHMGG
jgi:hypothetical protein